MKLISNEKKRETNHERTENKILTKWKHESIKWQKITTKDVKKMAKTKANEEEENWKIFEAQTCVQWIQMHFDDGRTQSAV